jgi:hypothetical protein
MIYDNKGLMIYKVKSEKYFKYKYLIINNYEFLKSKYMLLMHL